MNEEIIGDNKLRIEDTEDNKEGVESLEMPTNQPKKKRERTQKQKDALIKARETRKNNIERKKKDKLNELPPKHIKYKPIPKKPLPPMIVESEEPQQVIIRRVKRKKKKKPIIIEEYIEDTEDDEDDELTQDDINILLQKYYQGRQSQFGEETEQDDEEINYLEDDEEEYQKRHKPNIQLGRVRREEYGGEFINTDDAVREEYIDNIYDFSNNFD